MITAEQHTELTRWGITAVEPVEHQPDVWWARRGDAHVVVKTGDVDDRRREAAALRSYASGAVAVVAHDVSSGLLVVDRALPGDDIRPLARIDDDAATTVIAELITTLHAEQMAVNDGLPALSAIASAFDRPDDPRLPPPVVSAARHTMDDLLADPVVPVVLHGDLHHMNVLNDAWRTGSPDSWTAIDPHGWLGDPAFEPAAMLANPRNMVESGDARGMDGRELAQRLERRAAIFAEVTGMDVARIRAWALVGCVIAELWMIESHNLVHGAPLSVAQSLLSA